MARILAIAFGGFVATYIFLRTLLHLTQDTREPPAIVTDIPFFGPLVGMAREKSRFYLRLRFVHLFQESFEESISAPASVF